MNNQQYAVHLVDGRTETFDAIVCLPNGWIRCVTDEESSRMVLPETTYYHIDDVEQIERPEPNER